jgi:hypothetical protein
VPVIIIQSESKEILQFKFHILTETLTQIKHRSNVQQGVCYVDVFRLSVYVFYAEREN